MRHRAMSEIVQHAASARRIKKFLVLYLAVSLLTFLGYALHGYERVSREALEHLEQVSQTVLEHATNLLETHEMILDQVLDLSGEVSPHDLHLQEARLHHALGRVAARFSYIRNAMFWDETGRPVFSSQYYPVPREVIVSDRSYFVEQKVRGTTFSMNGPVTASPLTGDRVFILTKSRIYPDGRFGGVASTALAPEYFEQFYRRVIGDKTGLAIAFIAASGDLVAHYPPLAASAYPSGHPLLSGMTDQKDRGTLRDVTGLDGQRRHISFRKIAAYPAYVAVSLDQWSVSSEWRHDASALALFTFPALVVLAVVAWLAWKRSETEHQALLEAHAETEKRALLEEQVHHLEKLEVLGRLTSGLAHDFNNLLHVVSTNAAAIRLLPSGLDVQARLSAIDRAVAGGRSLIKHMLGFAHKKQFLLECVAPPQVLPGICEFARLALPKTILLHCTIEPDVHSIAVDLSELELALMNMALNARDAMPAGGTITVMCRNVPTGSEESTNAALPAQDFVAISVADTGTGIPPSILHRVFEPLFTTKAESGGSGLGLSRVQMYAIQLGGRATAANASDGGAVITMYIPAAGTRLDETHDVVDIKITQTSARHPAGPQ